MNEEETLPPKQPNTARKFIGLAVDSMKIYPERWLVGVAIVGAFLLGAWAF